MLELQQKGSMPKFSGIAAKRFFVKNLLDDSTTGSKQNIVGIQAKVLCLNLLELQQIRSRPKFGITLQKVLCQQSLQLQQRGSVAQFTGNAAKWLFTMLPWKSSKETLCQESTDLKSQ